MNEQTDHAPGDGPSGPGSAEAGSAETDDERRSARERVSDGFQRGLGVLSAFKEALEETIAEARERGDLSSDRARDAVRDAMQRARSATSEARERFDFVTQQEFEALARRVAHLEARLGQDGDQEEGAQETVTKD